MSGPDPITLALAVGALARAATVAVLIPARRALLIDPASMLKQ